MTRRRWIADEVSGNHATLTGAHAEHLIRVLRARIGQEFDISTGSSVRRGHITAIADRRVHFQLKDEVSASLVADLTLLLAIFKFDRMEWAIEKCTELGVSRIIPLIARRTDKHLVSASAKRVERWRRIARQAAEQSRRSVPSEIAAPMKLMGAIEMPADLRIVLSEVEEENQLGHVLASNPPHGGVILAIGPEGGWTEDEFQLFQKTGWIAASLGPTILRSETATIAASAIVVSALSPVSS